MQHRRALEDLARRDFLIAKAEHQKSEEELEAYQKRILAARMARQEAIMGGGPPGESLSQINDFIKGTEIKIERQRIVIKEKLAKVEELQLVLQKASIEYKMIDKLRARQHEEYRLAEKKLEEKELTEMTNSRFNLRQKNG
jgi:flagellar export protein FliJ